jgi:hypothetical protein
MADGRWQVSDPWCSIGAVFPEEPRRRVGRLRDPLRLGLRPIHLPRSAGEDPDT